ncbi:porin [Rubrivirga marina]|uniref:Porin domain-containing protein n=1 Tax=Rubrivirga marina TaxID=1196024 RepID=A0A271IUF4_9BACT|nr:porin [Rubrivirga marina]PAP74199.1 hypothetical protein BSZ37_21295 [Rubrivirga marina]
MLALSPGWLRLALALLFAAPAALSQTLPPSVEVSVGGKVHTDVRAFPSGPVGEAPGVLVRRARAEVEAEVSGRFRAVVEPGFGEGEVELLDGYVEADLWARPGAGRALAVRAGRFKTPVGYESLLSSSDLRFAERALPTALSPRRDLGAMLRWESPRLEAQVGVFNGVPDGSSASVDWGAGPDAAARVFGRPAEAGPVRLGVGLAVSAGTASGRDGDALAGYETPGDRTFFAYTEGVGPDGRRLRLAPQATLDVGRLHVLGEYIEAHHRVRRGTEAADLAHRAWQAAASFVVGGVPRGEGRPVPRRPVTEGGAGAVEVSARVHGLSLDGDSAPLAAAGSAQRAAAWALAVHWTPVAPVRLGVTVERTAFEGFDGDAPGGSGAVPPAETFVVGRFQIDL